MIDLDCRCLGRDLDVDCGKIADGEDGLCMFCRYADGGCCEGRSWDEVDAHEHRVLQLLAGKL